MTILDKVLLAAVQRRLQLFRSQADSADRFADKVMLLLKVEIARRNRLYDGWDKQRQKRVEQSADEVRRAVAEKRYEQDFDRKQLQ